MRQKTINIREFAHFGVGELKNLLHRNDDVETGGIVEIAETIEIVEMHHSADHGCFDVVFNNWLITDTGLCCPNLPEDYAEFKNGLN